MKKLEKWLWIIMISIILLIMFIIIVVIYNKNNANSDNYIDNIINLNEFLIEKGNWVCYDAYYYLEDGLKNSFDHDNLMLNFYDDYVEKCINGNCDNFTYNIDNDILKIDNEYLFDEIYTMKYVNDNLILEESHEIGTKIIYYLSNPVG